MITMRNYPKLGSYIVVENNVYSINEFEDRYKPVQGVGGLSESGDIVGIYVQDKQLFFFYNGQSFEVPLGKLTCTNEYVSKVERCFTVTIDEEDVCKIVYEPFVDPGMIYYDADPEEFDVLLYLSGLLKNEESVKGFMKGMNNTQERGI